jgi:1-aminocyclopropane-1-carboxylate deaminase/D-cysteine desulfhydrase-like pyridoxal-dependent ACC family enzyme
MRSYDENVPEIRSEKEEIILLEDFLGKGYAHIADEGYKAVKDMMSWRGSLLIQPILVKPLVVV